MLTVPVYDEGDSFFRLLSSVAPGPLGQALVIAVVNARDDSADSVPRRNRRLLSRVRSTFPDAQHLGNALLHTTHFGTLLCIDRSSRDRLPSKRGVGLARKIAGDLALALCARGRIASRWIHLTDADAVLPADYFARPGERPGEAPSEPAALRRDASEPVAAIYPFRHHFRHHSPDAAQRRAGTLHELYMRHYVIGLQGAGSPYAYHSIGSLIAVEAHAYAAVRGVPRRHGAEDFYLLNKLAKLGRIERMPGSPVELEARPSERVPFGTGPAIRRLIAQPDPPFSFHHPESFRYLAALLATVAPALASESSSRGIDLLREEGIAQGLSVRLLEEMADFIGLESMLRETMARSNPRANSASKPRSDRLAIRLRDFHTHFDALRTLQLLHWLRDRAWPSVDWQSAVSSLGLAADRDPSVVLENLTALEQRLCSGPRGLGV